MSSLALEPPVDRGPRPDPGATGPVDLPNLWLHPLLGLLAIAVFLGGFLLWAGTAPLASSAPATGVVKTPGNRRTIQNLEGGVIREILVQEGTIVVAGQALMRLHDEQSSALIEMLGASLDSARALRARLDAEANGRATIALPRELVERAAQPRIAEIIASQRAIFEQRGRTIANQVAILEQRIRQSEAEITSYEAQVHSFGVQLRILREEEQTVKELVRQGYEKKPRLLALQRQIAALDGNREQQLGLIARARQAISESELQARQIVGAMQRDATIELRDADARIVEAEERMRSALDIQIRRDILAPNAGMVMNLKFTTIGGVVRPGEPILEIVPTEEKLFIEANVDAQHHGNIKLGGRAEILLTSFKLRNAPPLHGRVVHVSADATPGAAPGRNFYRAHVEFDAESLQRFQARMGMSVASGMPAEVLIHIGDHTFLEYLVEPLLRAWRRAFTEA
ncbi:MAG: HlyD family type I secretion periplasmic adaptor subunit [Alphaproteobacteria bacterium]|nr:HlyD family type I secretion periplasmic adaptor subunit [Alphaproteobacteria bacterium]